LLGLVVLMALVALVALLGARRSAACRGDGRLTSTIVQVIGLIHMSDRRARRVPPELLS
jgi:hypothetical protein